MEINYSGHPNDTYNLFNEGQAKKEESPFVKDLRTLLESKVKVKTNCGKYEGELEKVSSEHLVLVKEDVKLYIQMSSVCYVRKIK